MSRRFASLYNDGSFNVWNEQSGLDYAQDKIRRDDPDTELVEVEIKVVAKHARPDLRVVSEHSAICPTCFTEVFIEVPKS